MPWPTWASGTAAAATRRRSRPVDFDPPAGAFLVAYRGGEPVGCGGWRSHGDEGETAELKRMYTVPAARGRGVARAVLAAVEDGRPGSTGASGSSWSRGDQQPEAIAMYQSCGYVRIENFGYYRDAPGCLSFGRPSDHPARPGRHSFRNEWSFRHG